MEVTETFLNTLLLKKKRVFANTDTENLFRFTHACKALVCAPFTSSENSLFPHQCSK